MVNRPSGGYPGVGGNNRPGGGNIGWGNHHGDNLGLVNRPNYGGNNFGGNTYNNTSYQGGNNNYSNNNGGGWGGGYSSGYNGGVNINNNIVNGGWSGGGFEGGGGGGYGGGWGGGYGGGGWASPYYGNWYRGNSASSFWTGLGVGALSSFGASSLLGLGGYGYGYSGVASPLYDYGAYSYFPTWSASNYGSWGLGSVASDWLYSGYTNPYYSTYLLTQPATTAPVVYDYSQPINVATAAPSATIVDSTEQVFSAARDSFKAGDYQRAVDLSDQVLTQTPNAAVVHEFRGLSLFALKRYDEASAVAYAVLSAGPGWNWSTLVGLYPDVDTYTNQIRALEGFVRSNPGSASGQFLLAYHYLVQGHEDAAAAQFEKVTRLEPKDQLSASFVKALKKVSEAAPMASAAPPQAPVPPGPAPASGASAQPPAAKGNDQPSTQSQSATAEPPPPPPASMAGTWTAKPAPEVTIVLKLTKDGAFTWEVDSKGQKQIIEGKAGFKDGTLALVQPNGPPLAGKVTEDGPDKFVFAPPGANDKDKGLTFTR